MRRPLFIISLSALLAMHARASSPFQADARLEGDVLRVQLAAPDGHWFYADQFSVEDAAGTRLEPRAGPSAIRHHDPFLNEIKDVYMGTAEFFYDGAGLQSVTVKFQGCNNEVCFFPEARPFIFADGFSTERASASSAGESAWRNEIKGFQVRAGDSGYMKTDAFLKFLESAPRERFSLEDRGMIWILALILLGGLALNLTPCVLPMIPVNLAVIGAGARAGSRRNGFLLGAAYGTAIALTYGMLGAFVVLTGSTFGSLNAFPWFNLGIALVFVLLALGMFDVIHIDFSRFQGGPVQNNRNPFWLALTMGAVSALLAGACVAPVVISVLVLSAKLYASGVRSGILLPFLLGAGMALPWPFAGMGLSFLPKPGKWMVWLRNGFGALILLLALYYAHLAWTQFGITGLDEAAGGHGEIVPASQANVELADGLIRAAAEGRPVLIDFYASWCKNCLAMDKTTLKDPAVQSALADYVFIKYAAENPSDPLTREVLEYFGVLGLPTYVILSPAVP